MSLYQQLQALHETTYSFVWSSAWVRLSVAWNIRDVLVEYAKQIDRHLTEVLDKFQSHHWRLNQSVLQGCQVAVLFNTTEYINVNNYSNNDNENPPKILIGEVVKSIPPVAVNQTHRHQHQHNNQFRSLSDTKISTSYATIDVLIPLTSSPIQNINKNTTTTTTITTIGRKISQLSVLTPHEQYNDNDNDNCYNTCLPSSSSSTTLFSPTRVRHTTTSVTATAAARRSSDFTSATTTTDSTMTATSADTDTDGVEYGIRAEDFMYSPRQPYLHYQYQQQCSQDPDNRNNNSNNHHNMSLICSPSPSPMSADVMNKYLNNYNNNYSYSPLSEQQRQIYANNVISKSQSKKSVHKNHNNYTNHVPQLLSPCRHPPAHSNNNSNMTDSNAKTESIKVVNNNGNKSLSKQQQYQQYHNTSSLSSSQAQTVTTVNSMASDEKDIDRMKEGMHMKVQLPFWIKQSQTQTPRSTASVIPQVQDHSLSLCSNKWLHPDDHFINVLSKYVIEDKDLDLFWEMIFVLINHKNTEFVSNYVTNALKHKSELLKLLQRPEYKLLLIYLVSSFRDKKKAKLMESELEEKEDGEQMLQYLPKDILIELLRSNVHF